MDFVSDALFDRRKFRALTVVDNYSRECLAIHVGKSLKGVDVVGVLEQLRVGAGIVPKRIQTDNGSEFISKQMDRWAYEHQVTMDYSRPGKPTDNPFVESFNGSFRDEYLMRIGSYLWRTQRRRSRHGERTIMNTGRTAPLTI